jgi:hypothetical protein
MSVTYASLAEAEQAGTAYIQVFSYNPELVTNPTDAAPATQAGRALP